MVARRPAPSCGHRNHHESVTRGGWRNPAPAWRGGGIGANVGTTGLDRTRSTATAQDARPRGPVVDGAAGARVAGFMLERGGPETPDPVGRPIDRSSFIRHHEGVSSMLVDESTIFGLDAFLCRSPRCSWAAWPISRLPLTLLLRRGPRTTPSPPCIPGVWSPGVARGSSPTALHLSLAPASSPGV